MDISIDLPGSYYFIRNCTSESITVNEQTFESNIVVFDMQISTEILPPKAEDLQSEHVANLVALKPEIILLGTGLKQVFPEPETILPAIDQGIAVEPMTTEAACRTYNLLAPEGRRVMLVAFLN